MKRILVRLILILLMIVGSFVYGYSQGNPLFSTDDTPVDTLIELDLDSQEDTAVCVSNENIQLIDRDKSSVKPLSRFLKYNTAFQKWLRADIAERSKQMREGKTLSAIIWILLISFLYGVAHSLGPGHNKVVVFSYFLSERPKIRDGILMGNIAAFVHALSGMIAAFIILFVINKAISSSFDQSQAMRISMLFSFGLISVIGVILLLGHLKLKNEMSLNNADSTSKKSIISMALAVGIIPCPGTMILVSFLATIGFVKLAVFAAFFMALGMGFTVSSIGIASIFMKQRLFRFMKNDQQKLQHFQWYLSIAGSLLIIIFGIIFFLGVL